MLNAKDTIYNPFPISLCNEKRFLNFELQNNTISPVFVEFKLKNSIKFNIS